uniref:Uncharacterized protein n=1 Tax=Ixodes ricinus TaxID=34613 RepID=A0A6B0U2C1_IXORI
MIVLKNIIVLFLLSSFVELLLLQSLHPLGLIQFTLVCFLTYLIHFLSFSFSFLTSFGRKGNFLAPGNRLLSFPF